MGDHTDYFDLLPDEVIQIIFSFITDWKSLVQCMSVSKGFRQHAARVTSLSIVCPGTFFSYDERLSKIYSMVKAFKNLESLVVRVGHPKEEPPSWARCMRYAEIGSSVEKFVFMAAKSGDFSELDATLLGLDITTETSAPKIRDRNDLVRHGFSTLDDSNVKLGSGSLSMVDPVQETSDSESDSEGGSGKQSLRRCIYSRDDPYDASFLQDPGPRKELSSFNLRRVISPSNDVLKRMLPVIHFAIVQGLDELRDALPPFVSQFHNLKTFLLVDMAESITVFLREHHIEQLKVQFIQELDAFVNDASQQPLGRFNEMGYFGNSEQNASLSDRSGIQIRDTGFEGLGGASIPSSGSTDELNEKSHDFVTASPFDSSKGKAPVAGESCSFSKTGILKGKQKHESADSFLNAMGTSSIHSFSSRDSSITERDEDPGTKSISFEKFIEHRKKNVNKVNSVWSNGTSSSSSSSAANGKQLDYLPQSVADLDSQQLQADNGSSILPGAIQPGTEIPLTVGESPEAISSRPMLISTETDSWQSNRSTRFKDPLLAYPENTDSRRKRSRDLWRKRQRSLEKDALSFDYTFWRSEQVSSCNYIMTDISMCIVTNAARPLREDDQQVLVQAAIAGPLLAATVSHVNKQYDNHSL